MNTLEMIVENLKTLPANKLAEAADHIRSLKTKSHTDRLAALERSAGISSEKEGAALERVIEEGCEKIDARGW